jgi:transcription antitermination factor NusG
MTPAWYILRSKPSKEEYLWGQIVAHHMEVYYPSIRAKAFSPTAHKAKPYFPGYLFIHIDLEDFEASFFYWIPGSRGLLGFGGPPVRVPDDMLVAIRRRVDRINQVAEGQELAGQVALPEDPFTDHTDIFDDCGSGMERVHFLINLLRDGHLQAENPVL